MDMCVCVFYNLVYLKFDKNIEQPVNQMVIIALINTCFIFVIFVLN